MTEQKRIKNPICETCRWYVETHSRGEPHTSAWGFCNCNPKQLSTHAAYFCSHHESAFDQGMTMSDMLEQAHR